MHAERDMHSQEVEPMRHLHSGRIYNRRKKASGAPEGNSNRNQRPQIEAVERTSSIVASELGVSKKTIQDLYLKCYTAEEIGQVVGLSKDAVEKEVSLINEDTRLHRAKPSQR